MAKTLRIRKSGMRVYEIRFFRGRDPVTRRQLTPWQMTWRVPEGYTEKAAAREAERIEREFKAMCRAGLVCAKGGRGRSLAESLVDAAPTFSQYTDIFLARIKRTGSENTFLSYRRILTRAGKSWGDLRLCSITRPMIKSYIEELQENYRYSTVCLHFDVLRNLFRAAAEEELVGVSPMAYIRKPACRKELMQHGPTAFTEDDIKRILLLMSREKLEYQALIYYMTDSGCRRGEVCGLTWDSVNLKTGQVRIRYNAQSFARRGVKILAPKNGRERTIILNDAALKIMKRWKEEQSRWCRAKGIPQCRHCFNNSKGEIMNPSTLTAMFRIWGRKYNIEGFFPHRLRHSMATISIANGADVVSVSKKLGHATPSVTLNVYSHVNEDAQRRANAALAHAIYEQ